MKKSDVLFVSIASALFLIAFLVVRLIDARQATGELYAKVFYQDQLILMIDLKTNEYVLYNTPFKDSIDVGLADQGVFYVPGTTTVEMDGLYAIDDYAKDNGIVGIKLLVEAAKIRVAYQESPRDYCELQPPTDSRLRPLICLPNELVVTVHTDMESDEFIPDTVLE
jgi:hypothetical protein